MANWFDKNKKSVLVALSGIVILLLLVIAIKFVLSIDFKKTNAEAQTVSSPQKNEQVNSTSDNKPVNNNISNDNLSPNSVTNELGNGISKFTGAWFEIKFPSSFTVKPSLKSTSKKGYESAFFISPDNDVEFYIYSPQWNGNATDIDLNPNSERIVSDITQAHNNQTIRYYTYESNDKSYTRSYQETIEGGGALKWIIGLWYKNQSAYNKYKKQYLAFKSSLVQFAD